MSDESSLLLPLGSNADSLLAGERVDDLRRRLKQASVTFDQVLLEQGILNIQAGPRGSSAFRHGDDDAHFQTPEERALGESTPFSIALGEETIPGQPASEMRTVLHSDTSISWSATLEPFEREFSTKVDWVGYVNLPTDPVIKKTAQGWAHTDGYNEALREAVPEQFVRSLIIKNANADLAVGAHAGVAVMQDPTHQQVLAARFDDTTGWQATGFALPIIVPETADLDWDTVADIRNHKAMTAFRQALRDVEARALADASGGDIETAVHRAFERYQAQVAPKLEGLPHVGREVAVELTIGIMLGVATAAITGPAAIPIGSALGVTPTVVRGTVSTLRDRKRRWDSVYNELLTATGTTL